MARDRIPAEFGADMLRKFFVALALILLVAPIAALLVARDVPTSLILFLIIVLGTLVLPAVLLKLNGNRDACSDFVRRPLGVLTVPAVLLATLITGLSAYLLIKDENSWQVYQATAAENGAERTVRLNDGSTLLLDINSIAEVRSTKHLREVRLRRGKAAFSVVRDVGRPFRVDVEGGVAEVLGTHFSVSVEERGATIEVQSGLVRVSGRSRTTPSVVLMRGERASILADGTVRVAARRSFVDSVSLGALAALLNTRGNSPRIIIRGSACHIPISGYLNLDDTDQMVGFLRTQSNLEIERINDSIQVRAASDLGPIKMRECNVVADDGSPHS